MNVWHTPGMRWGLTVFAIAMAGLAVWAYWRFGATPLFAITVVIAIGCFGAVIYLWRLARRALQPLEQMGKPTPPGAKEGP